ncbi:hypothetical protein DH2020_034704 [Rehmannia glutinosa]|uniref:MLO-like protein n=1 Tax=Rehmannia glutinosa TaxID=99300 RepID=A0ABR0VBW1_REHGL
MLESDSSKELRSLGLTPTWSVASVLTIFIVVSLLVERSIHRLGNWLKKTNRKPLLAAVEKMKEELMLLGFISLLLTATSSIISNICIPSKFYGSVFTPCTDHESDEGRQNNSLKERKLLVAFIDPHSYRRMLTGLNLNTCPENYEPFVSYEGLEQLHRFIFVMAVTHISYSCLTMLLAIVKTCFFRQFGHSVVRADYLTLRQGFITNHNLTPKYDFHSYMIRSMEEEFQRIVGVSARLWGFVVAFMLFNVKGSNLYFWIALIPVFLVLFVGTKLQHVIATLALESVGISGSFARPKLTGQFLCSYSTLPLYALVTQMGSNYKAALIPQRIRETIDGWKKAARRRRRLGGFADDSTVHTDTSTVISVEEYDDQLPDTPRFAPNAGAEIEMQTPPNIFINDHSKIANGTSSRVGTPLLRPSASVSSPVSPRILPEMIQRSSSLPR